MSRSILFNQEIKIGSTMINTRFSLVQLLFFFYNYIYIYSKNLVPWIGSNWSGFSSVSCWNYPFRSFAAFQSNYLLMLAFLDENSKIPYTRFQKVDRDLSAPYQQNILAGTACRSDFYTAMIR